MGGGVCIFSSKISPYCCLEVVFHMHGNMWIGCLYRYIRKSNEKIRNNTEWASESGKVGKKAKGRYFMVMLSAKESSRSFFITPAGFSASSSGTNSSSVTDMINTLYTKKRFGQEIRL